MHVGDAIVQQLRGIVLHLRGRGERGLVFSTIRELMFGLLNLCQISPIGIALGQCLIFVELLVGQFDVLRQEDVCRVERQAGIGTEGLGQVAGIPIATHSLYSRSFIHRHERRLVAVLDELGVSRSDNVDVCTHDSRVNIRNRRGQHLHIFPLHHHVLR